ncbi:TrmH family RNA methyltransferase [Nocardioides cavernaquae]|uniref:RNA methyltransferase n=1 Tax=Nocardioides cavernaquae TaxID=2321396 RepID=A0A3A5HB56_9ACTN|nr:RNA methyltransferase [Nocardioides cavernaquae]RJS47321.1 RNA methyltransferase [Nocardioides cavernaquae]
MASFPAEPLTSGNTRVKEARKLARRASRTETRRFLADGPKAVEGALTVEGCVIEIFATPAATEQYAALAATAAGLPDVPWTLVDDRALASLSDAVTPAGVIAVCRFIDRPLDHVLSPVDRPAPRLVVICSDVRDPGNAGTVIRTADAAGADAVILAGDAVDLYNPKTVRASVGSVFHLPVAIERDPLAAVRASQAAGLGVLAADMDGRTLFEADDLLAAPTAWLLGNEAWGIPAELRDAADEVVSIPIFGQAESLNLATAAAVFLYASARAQR